MSEIVRDSLKKTVKGTAMVFASVVLSMLIWFAARVIVVRITTAEELGYYSLAIAERKGFDALIRAVAEVNRGSELRLVLVWRGPDRERLAALAGELGIPDRVYLRAFRGAPTSTLHGLRYLHWHLYMRGWLLWSWRHLLNF